MGWELPLLGHPAQLVLFEFSFVSFSLCAAIIRSPSHPSFSRPLSRVSYSSPAKGCSGAVNREQIQPGPAPVTRFSPPACLRLSLSLPGDCNYIPYWSPVWCPDAGHAPHPNARLGPAAAGRPRATRPRAGPRGTKDGQGALRRARGRETPSDAAVEL